MQAKMSLQGVGFMLADMKTEVEASSTANNIPKCFGYSGEKGNFIEETGENNKVIVVSRRTPGRPCVKPLSKYVIALRCGEDPKTSATVINTDVHRTTTIPPILCLAVK